MVEVDLFYTGYGHAVPESTTSNVEVDAQA
jgi:hypothetical protein